MGSAGTSVTIRPSIQTDARSQAAAPRGLLAPPVYANWTCAAEAAPGVPAGGGLPARFPSDLRYRHI